jgi:hypothetical protein
MSFPNIFACQEGELEIVKWLHKNGCPCNDDSYHAAHVNRQWRVKKWIHQQLCMVSRLLFIQKKVCNSVFIFVSIKKKLSEDFLTNQGNNTHWESKVPKKVPRFIARSGQQRRFSQ